MHRVDNDREAPTGAASPEADDTPQPDVFGTTAAGRVWRVLSIVLGGAFTGMLIGAPVGLAANAVGLPSGGSAAVAALAFLAIALSLRWLLLRGAAAAEVTPLFEDTRDDKDIRRAA